MSDKEILEKAIQKAIDGGWTGCYVTHSTTNRWDVTSVPKLCVSFSTGGNAYFHPNEVLFNHDFAKALWGDSDEILDLEYLDPVQGMWVSRYEQLDFPRYKKHLMQMVIADDPIKYLGEHL